MPSGACRHGPLHARAGSTRAKTAARGRNKACVHFDCTVCLSARACSHGPLYAGPPTSADSAPAATGFGSCAGSIDASAGDLCAGTCRDGTLHTRSSNNGAGSACSNDPSCSCSCNGSDRLSARACGDGSLHTLGVPGSVSVRPQGSVCTSSDGLSARACGDGALHALGATGSVSGQPQDPVCASSGGLSA